MSQPTNISEGFLEVISPDGSTDSIRIAEFPFLIGRGATGGNHLQLSARHISRGAAAITFENGFCIADRGQRGGIYHNGIRIEKSVLHDGDVITFGGESSLTLTFRTSAPTSSVQHLLTQIENIAQQESLRGSLDKINLLLEAAMLLQSELPLEQVLGAMIDHAIKVTDADRGLLLEPMADSSLSPRLARGKNGVGIQTEFISPSQTAMRIAIERQAGVITEDVLQADLNVQEAPSIVVQQLRAVVVIPLYAKPDDPGHLMGSTKGRFLGILYLDSRRPAAFSSLDRQILDAIAAQAAGILQNAQLVEGERYRRRLEQEVNIAREIQQALLPGGFRDFPHLTITGTNSPCLGVGGDYFDVFSLSNKRTAFLIADVSGKGLGAALLTTMLQGALSGIKMGGDPANVFKHINGFLCEHADVGRYATMFFGILDCEGNFEFINAGHPSPLLLRDGEVYEPFSDGGFPVGLISEAEYTASSLKLQPNDVLVMFSDGVTEAENAAEEMFGVPRLRELLQRKCGSSLEELQLAILESVQTFSCGTKQGDDITLLLACYRTPSL